MSIPYHIIKYEILPFIIPTDDDSMKQYKRHKKVQFYYKILNIIRKNIRNLEYNKWDDPFIDHHNIYEKISLFNFFSTKYKSKKYIIRKIKLIESNVLTLIKNLDIKIEYYKVNYDKSDNYHQLHLANGISIEFKINDEPNSNKTIDFDIYIDYRPN